MFTVVKKCKLYHKNLHRGVSYPTHVHDIDGKIWKEWGFPTCRELQQGMMGKCLFVLEQECRLYSKFSTIFSSARPCLWWYSPLGNTVAWKETAFKISVAFGKSTGPFTVYYRGAKKKECTLWDWKSQSLKKKKKTCEGRQWLQENIC